MCFEARTKNISLPSHDATMKRSILHVPLEAYCSVRFAFLQLFFLVNDALCANIRSRDLIIQMHMANISQVLFEM